MSKPPQPFSTTPEPGLNFKELNKLIYNYSSRLSELDNTTLNRFLMRSLAPEHTVNEVKKEIPHANNSQDEQIAACNPDFIDDVLYKLWRKIIFRRNMIIVLIKLLQILCRFATPYLLDELTNNFKVSIPGQQVNVPVIGSQVSIEFLSWFYAFMLISCLVLNVFFDTQFSWNLNQLRYEGSTALQFLCYSKLVSGKFAESNNNSNTDAKQANISNLITGDCDKFFNILYNFHDAWTGLVNLILVIIVLYFKMKSALPIGLGVALFLLWLTSKVTKRMSAAYPEIMKLRDKRIELLTDVVHGIKSIKYLCWESIFQGKLQECRKEEFSFIAKLKYWDACCVIIWGTTSTALITATFIAYSLLGYNVSNANVFTNIAYFQMLIAPLSNLPWNLGAIVNSFASIKRIKSFLKREEIQKPDTQNQDHKSEEDYIISLQAQAMTWPQIKQDSHREPFFELKGINLKIKSGTLNMIIGNVSSGKTALLNAIMGELKLLDAGSNPGSPQGLSPGRQDFEKDLLNSPFKQISGADLENRLVVKGTIAYVPQNPWLLKESENILFGKKYDPNFYKQCLQACDLVTDIENLPGKDFYDVGLNGANLSGGQRQRISLCRALYQDVDIYLLDDILSAVDVSVARTLFSKAVLGLLVKRKKTVLLVLSQYKYLKYSNNIFLMRNGYMIEEKVLINSFVEGFGSEQDIPSLPSITSIILDKDIRNSQEYMEDKDTHSEDIEEEKVKPEKEEETSSEETEKGKIKIKAIVVYMQAMGAGVIVLIILGALLMQISRAWFDFWLRDYIDSKSRGENPWFFLHSFEITIFVLFVFSVVTWAYRAWVFAYGNLKSSKMLFNALIPKVMYGYMSFFDANPVGRIIQRFAEDSWSLDYEVPYRGNMFVNNAMIFVRTLYVLAIEVPLILILVLPVAYIFYKLQGKYRRVFRELKRMYSVNSGILLTHLAETNSGVVIVRAFKKEGLMMKMFLDKLRDTLTTKYLMDTSRLWFTFRLKSLSMAVSASVLIFSLLYKYYFSKETDFSNLALILLYALTSPLNFEDVMITLADTEKELIGIERINQYLENKTELEEEIESHQKKEQFLDSRALRAATNSGVEPFSVIKFTNVSLKYTTGTKEHYALRKVSLTIKKHEKIALCGRTGSGKTTILNSLLRLYNVDQGEITFNGMNILDFSKKELRSNIAVIPQFGFMYEATLKENLDPYGSVSTEKLQKALEKGREIMKKAAIRYQQAECQKKKNGKVKWLQDNSKLFQEDFKIERGGSNLSNGEKQIINFLRILLQDSHVVFLDEATSNVDPVTDELLYEALFEMCKDRTLIVITHRLEYLKHYDRVVLMEAGEIVDQGPYEELMTKPGGKFRTFVDENST